MDTDIRDTFEALTDLTTPWAVRSAIGLGIPTALSRGEKTAADLANELGLDPVATHRLMRYLVMKDVFTEQDGRYGLTQVAELMVDGHPSLVSTWLHPTSAGGRMDHAFVGMPEAVRQGRASHEDTFGRTFWDDMDGHPHYARTYAHLMEAMSTETAKGLTSAAHWADSEHIVDLGGGPGVVLEAVLRAAPQAVGVLNDLPATVEVAKERLANSDVSDRVTYDETSFLDRIPPGADTYLVSFILHAWDDDGCIDLLTRIREACKPGGKIVVIECTLGGDDEVAMAGHDLRMLVLVGGRERTRSEFESLFSRAGLMIEHATDLASGETVFECRVAGP